MRFLKGEICLCGGGAIALQFEDDGKDRTARY